MRQFKIASQYRRDEPSIDSEDEGLLRPQMMRRKELTAQSQAVTPGQSQKRFKPLHLPQEPPMVLSAVNPPTFRAVHNRLPSLQGQDPSRVNQRFHKTFHSQNPSFAQVPHMATPLLQNRQKTSQEHSRADSRPKAEHFRHQVVIDYERSKTMTKRKKPESYHAPGASGGQGLTKMMERRFKRPTVANTPRKNQSIDHSISKEGGSIDQPTNRGAATSLKREAQPPSQTRQPGEESTERRGQSQIQYYMQLQKTQSKRERVKAIVEKLSSHRGCTKPGCGCSGDVSHSPHRRFIFKGASGSVLGVPRIQTSHSIQTNLRTNRPIDTSRTHGEGKLAEASLSPRSHYVQSAGNSAMGVRDQTKSRGADAKSVRSRVASKASHNRSI